MRRFLHQAVEFGSRGLIETGFLFQTQQTDGFENTQRTHGIYICRVFRRLEAYGYMGLRSQVVNLVRLYFLDNTGQVGRVSQIAIVKNKVTVVDMGILIDMVYALGIERGGAAFDTVNFVAFFQQEFCEVGAVLAGDTGDESALFHSDISCVFNNLLVLRKELIAILKSAILELTSGQLNERALQ